MPRVRHHRMSYLGDCVVHETRKKKKVLVDIMEKNKDIIITSDFLHELT